MQLCLILVCIWMLCELTPKWRHLVGGQSKDCETSFVFAGRVDQQEMARASRVYDGCFVLLNKWWASTFFKVCVII
jgi:hypothetical protein